MKIQELISKPEFALKETRTELVYLEGAIAVGSEGEIRIYADPRNTSNYLSVNQADIIGEIEEIDSDFLKTLGFSGFRMFRMAVSRGTQAKQVTIKHHRLGETFGPWPLATAKTLSAHPMGFCAGNPHCQYNCCPFTGDLSGCDCDPCCVAAKKN